MLDMTRAREVFEASEDFTVGHRGGVRDPRPGDAGRWPSASRSCATPPQEDEVLAESVAGELIESEIEIRSGQGRRPSPTPWRASARPARACSRWPPTTARCWRATGTHPWSPWQEQRIIDTEHYRRRGGGPQVRGLAQQHLQPARARGRPRRRPRDRGLRPPARRSCPSCWRSRPTRRSSTAATRACTRRARQIFTKSFPRCGIPDPFGELRGLRRLRRPAGADRLDRRAHPALVERAPAPRLRHGRGADLRRPVERRGVRPRWPG